jgi:aerobic carbon-monoxide dehydrogenase large subunit
MDYAMPSAGDMPSFVSSYHPAPATTNPVGVNGCANAMVAVPNTIIDATSTRQ